MAVSENRFQYVGKPVPARETLRYATGRGEYIPNLELPNMWHAAQLSSPHAHARIVRIDAEKALRLDGVKGVLLGSEVPALTRPFPAAGVAPEMRYYCMAVDKVRFVGEPVAVVVARDRYIAEDAVDLIEVEYEPLPAVVDQEEALQAGAPLLHEELGTNLLNHRTLHWGDVEEAFRGGETVVVEDRFRFHSYAGMPLEGFGVVAKYDPIEDFLTLWANFIGPFTLYYITQMALKMPENKIRLIVPRDIGGAFGIKSGMFPDMVRIALAAKKFGCTVKWIQDRREHLLAGGRHSSRVAYVKVAATKDGVIKGMDERWYEDVGAYMRAPEPACLYRPLGNYVGGYRFRNHRVDAHAVAVNKLMTSPYRGYGCHPLYFGHERIVDLLAQKLGLDPVEIRMRNLLDREQFPYLTPSGATYESGDYKACMRKLVELFDYAGMRNMQARARQDGRHVGIGVAAGVDPSVSNMGYITVAFTPEQRAAKGYLPKSGSGETALVKVDPSGTIYVSMGTCQSGQSHETTSAQLVAQEFGVPLEQVTVLDAFDSSSHPFCVSTGTYASRYSSVSASAVLLAARQVKAKMLRIAAHLLQARPEETVLEAGVFHKRGALEPAVPFKRVAGAAHWNPASLPPGTDVGLSSYGTFSMETSNLIDPKDQVNSSNNFAFVADLAAVEVDAETGKVEILKYATVHDAGRILNPLFLEGQVYGCLTQALGGVFFEEMKYDENGQMLAASFMDYLCPTAMEAPKQILIGHVESPAPNNLSGAKGVGESNTETAPAALANAVEDALRPLGVRITELPLTPDRVRRLIREAQAEQGRKAP